MKQTVYVGVDPGARGAVAVLWPDGDVRIDPLPTSPVDAFDEFLAIAHAIEDEGHRHDVTIEQPQAYPINRVSGKTGKPMSPIAQLSVMLKMGVGFGKVIGALAAAGLWPIRRVVPQTWKSVMCGQCESHGKAKSIEAAQRLYPKGIDLSRGRSHKPDDNMADALMLAHYGRAVDKVPP